MSTPNSERKGKRGRTRSLGNTENSPTMSDKPPKLQKKGTEMEEEKRCCKCGNNPYNMYIDCGACEFIFCRNCCRLGDAIITAYRAGDGKLEGFEWKCPSCIKTTTCIRNIATKLDEIEDNNKERNDSLNKNLTDMEARITSKVLESLPSMIQKEMKGFEDKIEKKIDNTKSKLTKEIDTKLTKVGEDIEKVRDDMVSREEVDKMIKEAVEDERRKYQTKDEIKEMIQEAIPDTTSSKASTSAILSPNTIIRNTVAEIKQRQKKERNLVVYQLKEPETNVKNERIKADKEEIVKIATTVMDLKNVKEDDILRAERLGKDREKTRPLLIEFKDVKKKDLIMKRATKLKDSDYEHLSITYDMTMKEREQHKKLTDKAKEMSKKEQRNYRVRGPPWDLKIIEIQKEAKKEDGMEKETKEGAAAAAVVEEMEEAA